MTYQKLISTVWFTRTQISKAFDISRKRAESLCDKVTGGIANGGYGANIIEKQGQDFQERESVAKHLAQVIGANDERKHD